MPDLVADRLENVHQIPPAPTQRHHPRHSSYQILVEILSVHQTAIDQRINGDCNGQRMIENRIEQNRAECSLD